MIVRGGRGQHRQAARDGLQHRHAEALANGQGHEQSGRLEQGVELFLLADVSPELDPWPDAERLRLLLQRGPLRALTDEAAGGAQPLRVQPGHDVEDHADPLVLDQPAHHDQVGRVGFRIRGADRGQVDTVRHRRDRSTRAEHLAQPLGRLRRRGDDRVR